MDQVGDVLHRQFAEIVIRHIKPVTNIVVDAGRQADPVRFRQRLEPGSHVNAVAVDVVLVNDDVADIDAQTKPNLLIAGNVFVALGHAALNVHGV